MKPLNNLISIHSNHVAEKKQKEQVIADGIATDSQ